MLPALAASRPALQLCTYYRFQKMKPRVRNSRKINKNLAKFAKKNANFDETFEIIISALRTVQRSALCRSRQELSNAYFLAKFGFDTADNEHLTRTI